MIACVGFHTNPRGTIIIGTERAIVDMIQHVGDEGFVILWHAKLLVGWMVCWMQGVEKTIEFASAYETNIANMHGPVRVPWTRHPQCMSV